MKIIDSHAHLMDEMYQEDVEEVIKRCIENEMEILTSRLLSLDAVKDLKLYVEYRTEGRLKKVLIYKTQPVSVDLDPTSLDKLDKSRPRQFSFTIDRVDSTYRVKSDGESQPFSGSFTTMPATLLTPYGTLTFTANVFEGMHLMNSGERLNVTIKIGRASCRERV